MKKLEILAICILVLIFTVAFSQLSGAAEKVEEPIDWKLRALQAEVRVVQINTAWAIEIEKTKAIENRLRDLIRAGRQGKLDAATQPLVKYKKELAEAVKPVEEEVEGVKEE